MAVERNVFWDKQFNYFLIKDWPLPKERYNVTETDVVIIVPDNYGYGDAWKHAFLPGNLRYWHNSTWNVFSHYFDARMPDDRYAPSSLTRFRRAGWAYFCLHMSNWRRGDDALKYLHLLRNFLSDPLQPCSGNENAALTPADLYRVKR